MNSQLIHGLLALLLSAALCSAAPEKGKPVKAAKEKTPAPAAEETKPAAPAMPEKKASPEFARMKSLVGTWKGKADMGAGPVEATVQYRLIAGGSVLEERFAPGTPMEMVSMYYDKAGKLAMTHYCVLGNRPELALKSADDKSLSFELDAACCDFDPKKEMHMCAVTLKFDGPDSFAMAGCAMKDGKMEKCGADTVYKRVK
jgi:hypothetical protein